MINKSEAFYYPLKPKFGGGSDAKNRWVGYNRHWEKFDLWLDDR